MSRPQNWQDGVEKSRAVRSAKAQERAEAITSAFFYIARRDGPNTLAEYARIMTDECRTPSGRGKWSISLVHRYMRKGGWTPKSLRATFFKDRSDWVIEYPADLYAEWRAAIGQAHDLSDANGTWMAATERDLKPKQTVRHVSLGVGTCVERSSLATYVCSFHGDDDQFEPTPCRAIDLEGFEYFRSFEDRQQEIIDARERIFSKSEKGLRKRSDGWHL